MLSSLEQKILALDKRFSDFSSKTIPPSSVAPAQHAQLSRDAMNRLVIKIENLCNRMDSLEKKNENFINNFYHSSAPPPKQPYPLTSSLPNPTLTSRNPRTFASVANSHPNPNTKNFPPPLQQLPPIPKHSFINQFKLGQIIIRAKFGLPHPFPNLNA